MVSHYKYCRDHCLHEVLKRVTTLETAFSSPLPCVGLENVAGVTSLSLSLALALSLSLSGTEIWHRLI